jgi:hypothetical protein
MARSTLTTMIQRIQALANEVLGMPPEELAYFLDLIDPQAEQAKRKVKRRAKGKSARASQMSEQIKTNLSQRAKEPICATCGNVEDYVDHSEPSPSYHPFSNSPTAQSAGA